MVEKAAMINIISDAINEVFDTMVSTDIAILSDYTPEVTNQGIFASIAFRGSLQGRLTFHASQESSRIIAKNMVALPSEDQVTIEESCDAMGEVANMIMGCIKTRLHARYNDIQVSVPSIVVDQEIKSTLAAGAEQIVTHIYMDDQHEGNIILIYREV